MRLLSCAFVHQNGDAETVHKLKPDRTAHRFLKSSRYQIDKDHELETSLKKARELNIMSENCQSGCSDCSSCGQDDETRKLKTSLSRIKNKILVLSGKGGVGKSTVAVNLALALSLTGKKVGLLDVDFHGPSIPKMMGIEDERPESTGHSLLPVDVGNIKVMSAGLLVDSRDEAIIWRGPMKAGIIQQFLADVEWGDLDYLILDAPPGTGDEPLSVCQLIPNATGAIIVTTPQAVAASDVSRSISFCAQLNLKVLGIVENMSGFACPKCGEVTDIFSSGAGELLAEKYKIKLLGKIPIDPVVCRGGDDGRPFVHHYAETASAKAFETVVAQILTFTQAPTFIGIKKIAVATDNNAISPQLGKASAFSVFNTVDGQIVQSAVEPITKDAHAALTEFLAKRHVNVLVCGEIDDTARAAFVASEIEVFSGASGEITAGIFSYFATAPKGETGSSCSHC